jgi:hypothetical protein
MVKRTSDGGGGRERALLEPWRRGWPQAEEQGTGAGGGAVDRGWALVEEEVGTTIGGAGGDRGRGAAADVGWRKYERWIGTG